MFAYSKLSKVISFFKIEILVLKIENLREKQVFSQKFEFRQNSRNSTLCDKNWNFDRNVGNQFKTLAEFNLKILTQNFFHF